MSTPYTLVCGLEVHAELKTQSKMFCGCKNDPFHAPQPNCYTCPVCLGMPGALPVANATAIEWTIKLGLALGCTINLFSKFDRKHYFYPDLPKGYQISQYDLPFCYDGVVETSEGSVRVRRIHLEEDTGKLLHKKMGDRKVSLIDFNRSSVPLIEIVTEPDIHTPSQAKEYAKKLRRILRYLAIADCDMEQGGMRLEANISVQSATETELPNYKVEVKNINSFRFLEQAISYEVKRQSEQRAEGTTPPQETRGYNSTTGETFMQRIKEEAADYRYFPDPDLPPVRMTEAAIESLRAQLPELPDSVLLRWQKQWQIEPRFAEQLVETQALTAWAEGVFTAATAAQIAPNELVKAMQHKKIVVDHTQTPDAVIAAFIAENETESVSDDTLMSAIQTVVAANQDAVAKFKAGDTKVLGFFMGQVMRSLGTKVDPSHIRETLTTVLSAE